MYAVIEYTDSCKDNYVNIIHTTSDLEYAKKLAFHFVKKQLPKEDSYYGTTELKIVQNFCYCNGEENLYIENEIIVNYRIVELIYNDDNIADGGNGYYTINDVYKNVCAVIKLKDDLYVPEEIDTDLIL